MILDLDSIPFFLDKDATDDKYSLFGGVYSSGSSGLLRFEGDTLVLEFITEKSEYSMTRYEPKRGDVQTRTIPLQAIQSIECKRWHIKKDTGDWKHFWNPKLIITTNSLKALEGIPSAVGSKLMLTLEVRGLQNARAFAAQVMTMLADERLRRIESGVSQRNLPPAR
jgi:hypothetical protein